MVHHLTVGYCGTLALWPTLQLATVELSADVATRVLHLGCLDNKGCLVATVLEASPEEKKKPNSPYLLLTFCIFMNPTGIACSLARLPKCTKFAVTTSCIRH